MSFKIAAALDPTGAYDLDTFRRSTELTEKAAAESVVVEARPDEPPFDPREKIADLVLDSSQCGKSTQDMRAEILDGFAKSAFNASMIRSQIYADRVVDLEKQAADEGWTEEQFLKKAEPYFMASELLEKEAIFRTLAGGVAGAGAKLFGMAARGGSAVSKGLWGAGGAIANPMRAARKLRQTAKLRTNPAFKARYESYKKHRTSGTAFRRGVTAVKDKAAPLAIAGGLGLSGLFGYQAASHAGRPLHQTQSSQFRRHPGAPRMNYV